MRNLERITLACWKSGQTPFARIGAGQNYTQHDSSCGSLELSFRQVGEDNAYTYKSSYEGDASDIKLRIWLDNEGSFSMEFNVDIHGATQRKLEGTLKMLKAWNVRAEKLYMGGKESFDTSLRRMIAATGTKGAVLYDNSVMGGNPASLELENALYKFVQPAVDEVKSRFRKTEGVSTAP